MKIRPINMLSTKDPVQTYGHMKTYSERMENIISKIQINSKILFQNTNQKESGVIILISDKIDFKIKIIIRDKEGHYIVIKVSVQDKDVMKINIYAST